MAYTAQQPSRSAGPRHPEAGYFERTSMGITNFVKLKTRKAWLALHLFHVAKTSERKQKTLSINCMAMRDSL